MGKDKKNKKDKHKSKDKKRKRDKYSDTDSSSDSSEDERRKKRRAGKLAEKLTKHLEKQNAAGGGGRFIWHKKVQDELEKGKSVRDFSARAEHERALEREREIEKVRQQREERERAKADAEEALTLLNRERAVAEAMEAEAKEDEFHLEQLQVRAARRLREGRSKPIDHVARSLFLLGEFDADMQEPYAVLEGLLLDDVKQLCDEIKFYKALDRKDPLHVDYWAALATLAAHELAEAEKRDELDRLHLQGVHVSEEAVRREAGLHPAVERDIEGMLSGQSHSQLVTMEGEIGSALETGQGDPEYWEAVLRRLQLHKAKAKLREVQAEMVRRHVAELEAGTNVRKEMGWDREEEEQQQRAEDGSAQPAAGDEQEAAAAAAAAAAEPGSAEKGKARAASEEQQEAAGQQQHDTDEDEDSDDEVVFADGSMSPPRVEPSSVLGKDVVAEDDDLQLLEALRKQVQLRSAARYNAAADIAANNSGVDAADRAYQSMLMNRDGRTGALHPMLRNLTDAAPQLGDSAAFRSGRAAGLPDDESMRQFKVQADRAMGSDEGDRPFGGEVAVESQVYWWHEKYRPRKPKYFNRVHTGYEWNKYNQTHYDSDNPPPKVVQGYKFNIFYPDLIDKSVAPTFKVEKDPSSADGTTCTLKFSAGAPYEDIAFRVVNKEWEYSHKRGYKCTFERGILHLYFNFKRTRYRR